MADLTGGQFSTVWRKQAVLTCWLRSFVCRAVCIFLDYLSDKFSPRFYICQCCVDSYRFLRIWSSSIYVGYLLLLEQIVFRIQIAHKQAQFLMSPWYMPLPRYMSIQRRTSSATVIPSCLAYSSSHLICGSVKSIERFFMTFSIAPLENPVK